MPTRRTLDKPFRPETPKEGYPQRGRGRERVKRQSDQWAEIEYVDSLPSLPDEDYPEGTFVFNESNNEVYLQGGGSWISSSSYIVSSVEEEVSQAGSTGSLDLTIKDPNKLVTVVEFQKKVGSGSYGPWKSTWNRSSGTPGSSFTLTRGEDVALVEKHNSGLKWRVQFTNADGATETLSGTVEFDVDDIANVTDLSIAVDPDDGSLTAEVAGDADTATIYLTQTTDGSEPTDPTAANADETVNARSGSVTFSGVTVAKGGTARVKARGENAAAQLAPASTIKAGRAKRTGERSSVNLLGADGGPEHSGTGNTFYDYFDGEGGSDARSIKIADLDLEPGDVISWRAQVKSDTGADRIRLTAVFYDSGGTQLDNSSSNNVQSSTYAESLKENVEIPANTHSMRLAAGNGDATETGYGRRAMLNRGPVAAPYTEPPSTGDLIGSHTVDVDSAGNVLVSGRRRADVETVYFTVGVGSVPADPTASTNDHSVTAQTWEESDTGINATPIQIVYVKAVAELASGTLGEVESATAVAGPFDGGSLPWESGAAITVENKVGVAGQTWTHLQQGTIDTIDSDVDNCTGVDIRVYQKGGAVGSNFDMRNGGETITVPGTTISGLSCNTLYYVYYDHADGNVKADTNKAVAQDWNHMLLGSITTTEDRFNSAEEVCGGCGGSGSPDQDTKEII